MNPLAPARHARIVPLIVAFPMFLQNLDSSVLGTALPTMAASLGVDVLDLNLAITSYLASLVIFLPASAWLADRYGARRMFCAAVLLFTVASALCGAAQTLLQLVVFRMLQGVGGSMMVPVGRLILLQTVPQALMLQAMVWFTVPGGIARALGPVFGGVIVTLTSWRWIFLVNIPCGIAAVWLALKFIEPDPPAGETVTPAPDFMGIALLGTALAGFLGALELADKHLLPWWGIVGLLALGASALWIYLHRMRSQAEPVIDFSILRFQTYRTSVAGAMPLRIAIGAAPFLVPLLLQLGLGLPPLDSGLLMLAGALAGLAARGIVKRGIQWLGYRLMLIISSCGTSLVYASYMLWTPATPQPVIAALLIAAGLFNSTSLVILSGIGYAEIPRRRMAHATVLASMGQQLAIAVGVAVSALLLQLMHSFFSPGAGSLQAMDFRLALVAMAAVPLISTLWFTRLPRVHVG